MCACRARIIPLDSEEIKASALVDKFSYERISRELTALKVEVANNYANVEKIINWMSTDKPAVIAFTEGPERQIAYAIEFKIRKEKLESEKTENL